MHESLKKQIIDMSNHTQFKHHKRFIVYHLNILEQICKELVTLFPCNKDIVFALVRIHDYTKICHYDDHEWFEKWHELLISCWYTHELSKQILEYRKLFEQKMIIDLHTTPIEIQIVSSADAMSHYIWPFFPIYRYEHPEKSIEELMSDNIKKLNKDINRKVTLPEVKEFLEQRVSLFQERFCGTIPQTFFT
jgi:hypothetical protein